MQMQTSKRAAYNWPSLMWMFGAICVGWWLASGCASPKQVRLYEDTPSRDAPSSEPQRRHRQPSAERTDSYGRASGHSPSITKHSSPYSPRSSPSHGMPSTPHDSTMLRRARPPEAEERPGLGTSYGESLYAPSWQTQFVRASSQPFYAAQLNYNDQRGLLAMTRYLRGVSCCQILGSLDASGISVRLTDEHGRSLRGLYVGGRMIVLGQHGQRYSIEIRNRMGYRVEVVASVDGRDVIDGMPAHLSKRGYVLRPHQTIRIGGFRRSTQYVAAFRFSQVSQSYAARMGSSANVGVIGIAAFVERPSSWSEEEIVRRLRARPFQN